MAKVKKAQKGGCLSTTGSGTRTSIYKSAAGEGGSGKADGKAARQFARAERKMDKAQAKMDREEAAAKAKAPKGKSGLKVKKAQSGKMVPSEMKPGKMIKKADRDARATKMANALDKQAGKGSSARPMGLKFDKKSFDKVPSFDEYIKKTESKKVAPKKKMMNGGKAKKMMSGGKCKYGC